MNPVNVRSCVSWPKQALPPETDPTKHSGKQILQKPDTAIIRQPSGKHSRANVITYKAATHLKLAV